MRFSQLLRVTLVSLVAMVSIVDAQTVKIGVFKSGFLRLQPELRYTRWSNYTFRSSFRDYLRSNRNSLDFLLGISFSP